MPALLVVDASVALKWVLPEPDSALAQNRCEKRRLVAPELLLVECANVLCSAVRAGRLSQDEARGALDTLMGAPVQLVRNADLVGPAQALAFELGHPIYDCLYLALAQRVAAPLLTADRRFAARVQGHSRLAASVVPLSAVD